jgi:transcriptional regulator with XRE-family HTH domain
MRKDEFEALIAGLESQGISRSEIAQRSGMSRTTVWRMANGICADHLAGTVQRIEKLQHSVRYEVPVSRVKQRMG